MHDVPERIVEAVNRYHHEYRNAALEVPSIVGLYALFPNEVPSVNPEYHWPARWPCADLPGVYVVLGRQKQILYVGKAAVLGVRVSHYFFESRDGLRKCMIRHKWIEEPAFVVFISISKRFEAPSLEEYLIEALNPLENKLWKDRGRKAPAADSDSDTDLSTS